MTSDKTFPHSYSLVRNTWSLQSTDWKDPTLCAGLQHSCTRHHRNHLTSYCKTNSLFHSQFCSRWNLNSGINTADILICPQYPSMYGLTSNRVKEKNIQIKPQKASSTSLEFHLLCTKPCYYQLKHQIYKNITCIFVSIIADTLQYHRYTTMQGDRSRNTG